MLLILIFSSQLHPFSIIINIRRNISYHYLYNYHCLYHYQMQIILGIQNIMVPIFGILLIESCFILGSIITSNQYFFSHFLGVSWEIFALIWFKQNLRKVDGDRTISSLHIFSKELLLESFLNPLSAKPTKWSNTNSQTKAICRRIV